MPMAAHVADGMHRGVHGVPYHAESTLSSAQVLTIKRRDLQKEWRALDDYTAANWQPGDTKIRYRESIRFIFAALRGAVARHQT